jgi:putative endonuclease
MRKRESIGRHSGAARSAEPGIHTPRVRNGTLRLSTCQQKVRHALSARYGVDKLVWFEIYDDVATAIAREKELKKWRRDWKIRLIEEENPGWVDLYPEISN